MATSRILLKLKTNTKLPIRFLLNSALFPTRPVSSIAEPILKAPTFSVQGMTQSLFVRGMATGSSSSMPRGGSKKNEEEEDDAEDWEDDDNGGDEWDYDDVISDSEDNDEEYVENE